MFTSLYRFVMEFFASFLSFWKNSIFLLKLPESWYMHSVKLNLLLYKKILPCLVRFL